MAESIAAAWNRIAGHPVRSLGELFAGDPDRVAGLSGRIELGEGQGGMLFDWSKTHLDAGLLDQFAALAEAMDLAGKRDALFNGDLINNTEGRPADHAAQRGVGVAVGVE